MRLWTMQTIPAWEQLQETGVLRGNQRWIWEDFLPAYCWLRAEMARRLGAPPDPAAFPIWAWYQREGRRRQPDLRYGGYFERGTPAVCLEVDVPDERVLLSDFDLWHYVLNGWHLAASLEGQDAFHGLVEREEPEWKPGRPLLHPIYPGRVEQSWQLVFELGWQAEGVTHPPDQRSIQATFWELRLGHVRRVQHFHAR